MKLRPLVLALVLPLLSAAAVTQIQVVERSDVLGGKAFGPAGAYERILAKARFAIDPRNAANRIITDIDRAPRNDAGLVEFTADLYVLKPRDSRLGNGTVLLEVPNRGGKGMLSMFDFASSSRDPKTEAEFGDGYLLERGYTLVWVAWQFDVPETPGAMRLTVPSAGADIAGLVRSDFVRDSPARSAPLGDMGHKAYATVDLDDTRAQLTVRDRVEGKRQVVPRSQWRFAREEDGRPVADATSVYLASGFQPGKIYEVVYRAKNPPVMGLGLAAVRDVISYLKFGGPSTGLSDEPKYIKRALGFGTSQSGRFLRHFLYQDFNADENGRQVFDGVWAHVAGAGRGNFNARFAQASRDARPFLNLFYPVDIYPFTDLGSDGLLSNAKAVPKIFYTNGSYEYWGRAASLIHTTPDGKVDAPLAPLTRVYFNAGAQHGSGALPPRKVNTKYVGDPEDYRFQMRALLMAMQAWLKDGKEPPASQYPQIAKGQLVRPEAVRFPKIDDVTPPKYYHKAYRVDYGPEFVKSAGVIQEPPKVGEAFAVMVPQVDADGIDMGGVRLPEIQAPLGTYTGWNFRDPKMAAPDEMANFIGSYFPFARTKAEREKTGDRRLSVEERYGTREGYLAKYSAAARDLVRQGYVLERDLRRLMQRADALWNMAMKQ